MTKIAVYFLLNQSVSITDANDFFAINELGLNGLLVAFQWEEDFQSNENPDLRKLLSTYPRPSYVFFAQDPNEVAKIYPVATITGVQSQQTIVNKINELTAQDFAELLEIGNGGTPDPIDLNGSGDFSVGFPFGFLSDVPKSFWLIIAIAGGYKTITSESDLSRAGFGTITGIATINYYLK